MNMKRAAGEKACELIQEGMLVGLGTGSTVFYTIEALGRRVREGLKVTAVATSKKTEQLASANQIPLISLNKADEIDLTIDGADEVDADFNGIKGGGGALLREKNGSAQFKAKYLDCRCIESRRTSWEISASC